MAEAVGAGDLAVEFGFEVVDGGGAGGVADEKYLSGSGPVLGLMTKHTPTPCPPPADFFEGMSTHAGLMPVTRVAVEGSRTPSPEPPRMAGNTDFRVKNDRSRRYCI